MFLTSYNEVPFVDRPSQLRVQVLEIIDLLEGDVVKYTRDKGGIIVEMPHSLGQQNAIGLVLQKIGLGATGWRDSTRDSTAFSHQAEFELIRGFDND